CGLPKSRNDVEKDKRPQDKLLHGCFPRQAISPRSQNSPDASTAARKCARWPALTPFALGLSLQGDGGKGFTVVRLGHHAPVCADASPSLDKQDASEKIGLHVKPIEAAHVARWIDAAKMHGVHGASLPIVQPDTLELRP